MIEASHPSTKSSLGVIVGARFGLRGGRRPRRRRSHHDGGGGINNSCSTNCPTGQTPKNIYPVLSMGLSGKDLYMRAIMNVPQNNTTFLSR